MKRVQFLALLSTLAMPPAAPEASPGVDLYADPLPAGALVRLGTVRLRQPDIVGELSFSSDGKSLVAGCSDGVIRLWDTASGRLIRQFKGHQGYGTAAAYSPDGKLVASGGIDLTVRLWDPATGRELRQLKGHSEWVISIGFSPDGKLLASSGFDDPIRLWDPVTGEHLRTIEGAYGRIQFSPDSKLLTGWSVGVVSRQLVWDVATGNVVATIAERRHVLYANFTPDGRTLVHTLPNDGTTNQVLRFCEIVTGQETGRMELPLKWAHTLRFLPDGKTLVCGANEEAVLVEFPSGKLLHRLAGSFGIATTTSRDGKLLAGGGTNTAIRLWDTATGKELHGERGHTGPIDQVAFAPDGEAIVTAGSDGAVRMWDLTGREIRRLDGIGYRPQFSLTADGGMLAVASTFVGKQIQLWAPATGKEISRIGDFQGSVGFLDLSADGKRIAASGSTALQDPVLRVWDVATKGELFHIDQPGRSGTEGDQVQFTPDGLHLVSTFGDGTLRFWNPATGEESVRLTFEDRAGSFTIDPSGQLLAVEFEWGPTNRRLKNQQERIFSLVEIATGQEVLRIPGRGAFSPDGKLIAINHYRGDVIVCCTATGQQVLTLPGHGWLTSVAFSPDGLKLATAGADCSALVWDLGSFTIDAGAQAKQYTEKELRQLWTELRADKASTAYQAAAALVASPDQAVTLLKQHLQPAEPVKDPDASEKQTPQGLGPTGEALRTLRALRILEQVGTEETREVLESLARGHAEARSTRQAKAALERLSKRIAVR